MKSFLIITRDEKELNRTLARRMASEIELKGGRACIAVEPPRGNDDPMPVPEGTDCILTVGGDGALIRATRRTFGTGVPLLGINAGHLGYLCDLDADSVFDAIDSIISGDYDIEERMLLEGGLESSEKRIAALNDIVISSENPAQVISITVYVNGTVLYRFNGDGIIFSTPTGSTAYNLSANGPIVDPLIELILMTPINPHTLNSRSIILSSADEIAVEITRRRQHTREAAIVSFDGNSIEEFLPGDRVLVRKAAEKARIVRLSDMNFLERIGKKLKSETGL